MTIPIYYIRDLFKQEELDEIDEHYSCTICSELIYKQEWYQCSQGHTACLNCWNKIISSGSKKCHSCRIPIKSLSDGLSRCRFIEQAFINKKVNCPYKFKDNIKNNKKDNKLEEDVYGCKEIIKIEELDNHKKSCNYRFVKCNNKGCSNTFRYQFYLKHEKKCRYSIIQCKLCNKEIKKLELVTHQKLCPSRIIKCTQCPKELKNFDLEDHIAKECPNTAIQCEFKEYGCDIQMKRSELSTHFGISNHSKIILNLMNKQSQELKDLKKTNSKYQIDLQECKKQLFEVNNKYNDLLTKFNSLLKFDSNIPYCNNWIISDFKQRTGPNKPQITSPSFNIGIYTCVLFIRYLDSSNFIFIFLKGPKEETLSVELEVKVLSRFDVVRKHDKHKFREYLLDNSHSMGFDFMTEDSKNIVGIDYFFPDGSMKIQFSVKIEQPALKS